MMQQNYYSHSPNQIQQKIDITAKIVQKQKQFLEVHDNLMKQLGQYIRAPPQNQISFRARLTNQANTAQFFLEALQQENIKEYQLVLSKYANIIVDELMNVPIKNKFINNVLRSYKNCMIDRQLNQIQYTNDLRAESTVQERENILLKMVEGINKVRVNYQGQLNSYQRRLDKGENIQVQRKFNEFSNQIRPHNQIYQNQQHLKNNMPSSTALNGNQNFSNPQLLNMNQSNEFNLSNNPGSSNIHNENNQTSNETINNSNAQSSKAYQSINNNRNNQTQQNFANNLQKQPFPNMNPTNIPLQQSPISQQEAKFKILLQSFQSQYQNLNYLVPDKRLKLYINQQQIKYIIGIFKVHYSDIYVIDSNYYFRITQADSQNSIQQLVPELFTFLQFNSLLVQCIIVNDQLFVPYSKYQLNGGYKINQSNYFYHKLQKSTYYLVQKIETTTKMEQEHSPLQNYPRLNSFPIFDNYYHSHENYIINRNNQHYVQQYHIRCVLPTYKIDKTKCIHSNLFNYYRLVDSSL